MTRDKRSKPRRKLCQLCLFKVRRHPRYRLTDEHVKQIREAYAKPFNERARMHALSKAFGVSTTQIWRIIHEENWAHVG